MQHYAIDLFCGAGGLSQGFQQTGFEIIVGVDNDQAALDTFEYNHKNSIGLNADLSKQETFDKIIADVDAGKDVELPKLIITADKAVEAGGFANPYAKAKAYAAYEICGNLAKLDTKGCFMMKDYKDFLHVVAAAHEMARVAANLATEAREIEKSNDTVMRTPHMGDGSIGSKVELISKPQ